MYHIPNDIIWVHDYWKDDLEHYLGNGETIASHSLAKLISSKGKFIYVPDSSCPNGRNYGYEIDGTMYYFRYINNIPNCRKEQPV